MDIQWQNSIEIKRPLADVYTYLADFERHKEWAQTLARIERIDQTGNGNGVGKRFLTYERQAMQSSRKPREIIKRGLPAKTLCEIRGVIPNEHIAWHAHSVPKVGLRADLSFDFVETESGRTRLQQSINMHIPGAMTLMFQIIFGRDIARKARAQWDASLHNIKAVLEEERS